MKFGETITIGEDDLMFVRVSNSRDDHSLYYGPCNMATALKVAEKSLRNYKTVSIEYLSLPEVIIGEKVLNE